MRVVKVDRFPKGFPSGFPSGFPPEEKKEDEYLVESESSKMQSRGGARHEPKHQRLVTFSPNKLMSTSH